MRMAVRLYGRRAVSGPIDTASHRALDEWMSKGWAKGLTASADARVARGAEGHRGKRYIRRTPRAECRWPTAGHTTLPLAWSDEMAYLVGLTTTDGCLGSGGRKLNFKSSDRELVVTYLEILGRDNRIKESVTRTGTTAYFTEFSDAALYDWFRSTGLHARKSLTIGELNVPDRHFAHFLRGHLDGDGSILDYTYAGTGKASGRTYRTLNVRFISASRPHVAWLQGRIDALFGLRAPIGWGGVHTLTFAKRASLRLLPSLYPSPDVPCLTRKREIWERFSADMARGVRGAVESSTRAQVA